MSVPQASDEVLEMLDSPLMAWRSCKVVLLVSMACMQQGHTVCYSHTQPLPHQEILVARVVVHSLLDIDSNWFPIGMLAHADSTY